ncbi:MAG: ABC transporter [Myxococcales bacterium]|nr:ABC transporter [Myxococcales bacterium]
MAQIEVEQLVKTYAVSERRPGLWGAVQGLVRRRQRRVKALDGVSFEIGRGELVAYIGPNGAGKSTTVKVLSGILVPDGGRCVVEGRVPWEERIAHVAQIGVVFGQRTQLWWDLPVVDSFELLRDIYRVEPPRWRRNLDELVALLDLEPLLDVPVRQLSLGQRMRCDLAAALLHGPSLLFLDEPTIGLDAVSKLAVRAFIQRLNRERQVTVILTTHDMDDIEALCDRVMVIARGQILCDGSLEALRTRFGHQRRLTLELADPHAPLVPEPGTALLGREGARVSLAFDPAEVTAAELIGRLGARYAVRDLWVEELPIEEVVARLYDEEAAA